MAEVFTAAFWAQYGTLLWEGTLATLGMVFFSTACAYVLGLPAGILLCITKKDGIAPAPRFNAVFGWVLNIIRSLPFVILILYLRSFVRMLIGSSVGAPAATVTLVIAAAPFVARMVEVSLEEVNSGLIEAARTMGASNFQIVTRVMLVESIPSLVRGLSISLITILGYAAMAGVVGGGGLGDIAYRYGAARNIPSVMNTTVILLILLVCVIQSVLGLTARRLDKRNR